ncbi:MAG: T9SS type A sorting domain-containing protein [Bacteroidales bacterium]|nr:T9SS type A sorting domain-containing protein [Bacteroidales bacterium]
MKKKFTIISVLLLINSLVFSQDNNENYQALPIPYENSAGLSYGQVVSIDGNYAAIGCPGYDSNSGKVELLEYSGSSWEVVAVLTSSNVNPDDNFGSSVCINQDIVIIGAYNNDELGTNVGMAYIFEKPSSGWTDMTETVKLFPSDGDNSDLFGVSVAVNNDIAYVGASGWDGDFSSEGAIYVFQKTSTTWEDFEEIAMLNLSDPSNIDQLGKSISVYDDILVAGVSYDDENGTNSGAAYIFEKPVSGWANATETAKLTATDCSEFNYFGNSVSVYGNTVVVGTSASKGGYIFEKPITGWIDATQDAKLTQSIPEQYDGFGKFVSIDDQTIIIGAPYSDYDGIINSGSAYIYSKPSTGWVDAVENAVIYCSNSEEDFLLGSALDISGDIIVVGIPLYSVAYANQGGVCLYHKPVSGWVNNSSEDYFLTPLPYLHNAAENAGYSVSISGDYAVMGAYGYNDNSGLAYVLYYDGSNWNNIAQLSPSDAENDAHFGYSVAIHDDVIVVGAYQSYDSQLGSGSIYVFEKPIDGWSDMTETAKLTASVESGRHLGYAIAFDGNTIVAGAPFDNIDGVITMAGSVYVFEKPEDGWATGHENAILQASDPEASDYFGSSVAVENDIIVVGHYIDNENGNSSGSIYVYEKSGENWINATETTKFSSSNSEANCYFGYSVDISNQIIVAGSFPQLSSIAGFASVFQKDEGNWVELANLSNSDATSSDNFGIDVSIDNDIIVVGANNNSSSGASYLFKQASTGWTNMTETIKLTASDATENDYFGINTDIQNGKIIIGANGLDSNGSESGGAYLFLLPYVLEEPESISNVCGNEVVSFDISAVATGYQWQISDEDGIVFSDINDDEVFTGYDSESLVVNLNSNLDNLYVRCNVFGGDEFISVGPYQILLENELPELEVQNIEIFTDESGFAYLNSSDLVVLASDNCMIEDTILSQSVFNCDENSVFVDVAVIDISGNSYVQVSNVTVTDTIKPEINCAESINVVADQGQQYYTVQGTEIDPTNAADNCGVESILNDFNNLSSLANVQIPDGNTTIIWTATDNSGNQNTCTLNIFVDQYVGFNDLTNPNTIAYPNPFNNYLNLENQTNSKNVNFEICDALGQILIAGKVDHLSRIDTSELPFGAYILKIKNEKNTSIIKIIKE